MNKEVLLYLKKHIEKFDKELYELIAYCIMPNHVHLLLKPLTDVVLIMQKIKGSSAKQINTMLNKTGKFWAREYFDKLIRDERHFNVVYNYIKNNPMKLNEKVPKVSRFYGLYE